MKYVSFFLNLPFVAKTVNHQLGGFVVTGVGAIVGFLAGELPKVLHVQLTPETQANLTQYLTAGGMAVGAGIVQYVQTGSAKALQQALGVVPDGWVGPKTIVAVKRAVAATPAEVAQAESGLDSLRRSLTQH